ncbi:hypothetical protein BD414DRAFT_494236 [Trametes punicea]|nr:hypothetical protein BD414DRAFT_494236 [Trametes punicea]
MTLPVLVLTAAPFALACSTEPGDERVGWCSANFADEMETRVVSDEGVESVVEDRWSLREKTRGLLLPCRIRAALFRSTITVLAPLF